VNSRVLADVTNSIAAETGVSDKCPPIMSPEDGGSRPESVEEATASIEKSAQTAAAGLLLQFADFALTSRRSRPRVGAKAPDVQATSTFVHTDEPATI
jgi:hypothetical protein